MPTIFDLLNEINTKSDQIIAAIGAGPLAPHLQGVHAVMAAPGFVTATAVWNAPPPGDSTDHYTIVFTDPTGTQFSSDLVPAPAVTFAKDIPATAGNWTCTLTSFNSAGVPCVTPASVQFPVTPAPPPPPSNPTGLTVTVA